MYLTKYTKTTICLNNVILHTGSAYFLTKKTKTLTQRTCMLK